MRLKIRHKLLLLGVTVAAVTAAALFLTGGMLIRRSIRERVSERLEIDARLLVDDLARRPEILPAPVPDVRASPETYPAADGYADRMGSILGLRVTILAADGTVVGDSALNGPELTSVENHAKRPEVLLARMKGSGISERVSSTVHDDLLYLADRVDRDGQHIGYVRLATPVSQIERTTGNYDLTLALFSFAALMAITCGGYLAARSLSRPIEEMSRTAEAVAAGRHELEVEYESDDEVGLLGRAVNRMKQTLSEQIEALSGEKRLRDTILKSMEEGILVVDGQRRVLLCNDAVRPILGLKGGDPTGRPLIEITRNPAVIEGFDGALLRGDSFREVVHLESGLTRAFEISVAPLTDAEGARLGAVGIFFDVSRLMALESLRREFVADVSHELRTPLTAIRSFVETLLHGGIDDTKNNRRFLEIIKKHSDRMEAILDDLTDLSLIETGSIALDVQRLELAPLLEDLVESLEPKAVSAGVSLRIDVPPRLYVLADSRRLEQIFINLVDNAIKFNRAGGTVTVLALPGDEGSGMTRVEVNDTGVGIPPTAIDKIFHRFFRVDRARSRDMGGTGLGLSIVKHLARLHGGTVEVRSELGKGSRFILELPAGEPSPGDAAGARRSHV